MKVVHREETTPPRTTDPEGRPFHHSGEDPYGGSLPEAGDENQDGSTCEPGPPSENHMGIAHPQGTHGGMPSAQEQDARGEGAEGDLVKPSLGESDTISHHTDDMDISGEDGEGQPEPDGE
jgi:hypothetical protein